MSDVRQVISSAQTVWTSPFYLLTLSCSLVLPFQSSFKLFPMVLVDCHLLLVFSLRWNLRSSLCCISSNPTQGRTGLVYQGRLLCPHTCFDQRNLAPLLISTKQWVFRMSTLSTLCHVGGNLALGSSLFPVTE